jgi:hypothetical protein
VSDTVRREEVTVEGADGAVVDDSTPASGRTRSRRDESMRDRGRDAVDDLTDRPI